MKRIVIGALRAYQAVSRSTAASPFFFGGFSGCRSVQTCSEYALEVIESDGVCRGIAKAVVRIARCNPLRPVQNHG